MNSEKRNRFPSVVFIDIKELCWKLLEQWKIVVCFSVIVAAVFSGFLYMHHKGTAKQENEKQTAINTLTEQELIETLPKNEQFLVSNAYHLLEEKDKLSEYIQNAPLMQLDPNHMKRLRVSWAVDVDSAKQEALLLNYAIELQSIENIETLLNNSGVDVDSSLFGDSIYITYPDERGKNAICCDYFLTDDMPAERMQVELNHIVDQVQNELENEFGAHSILNYNIETADTSDKRVFEDQVLVFTYFSDMNNQLANIEKTLSTGQKEVFAELQSKRNHVDAAQASDPVFSFIHVLVGLLLGLIIYVLGLFIYIFVTNRIISVNTLGTSFTRNLGEWYSGSAGSMAERFWKDPFIWSKHHQGYLDKEEAISSIFKSVSLFRERDGFQSLTLLATAAISQEQDTFIHELINTLTDHDIDAEIIHLSQKQDLLRNENHIIDADGIVLVLVGYKTRVKDVERVINYCNSYEKDIIGRVLIG